MTSMTRDQHLAAGEDLLRSITTDGGTWNDPIAIAMAAGAHAHFAAAAALTSTPAPPLADEVIWECLREAHGTVRGYSHYYDLPDSAKRVMELVKTLLAIRERQQSGAGAE